MSRRQIGTPIAGYYTVRLIRGGLRVPVAIWFGQPIVDNEMLDRSPRWCAMVDGRTDRADYSEDGSYLGRVPLDPIEDDIWTHCGPKITPREYDFLRKRTNWAVDNDPLHPAANPRQAIDLRALKPGW